MFNLIYLLESVFLSLLCKQAILKLLNPLRFVCSHMRYKYVQKSIIYFALPERRAKFDKFKNFDQLKKKTNETKCIFGVKI